MNNDSFFSVDRLVEFGLGMGVANQMIQIMNESLKKMYVPGAGNAMQLAPSPIYIIIDNQQSGPYYESELSKLIQNGKLTSDTYVWKPGMLNWKQAKEVPDILKLVALVPPSFNNKKI